MKPSTPLKRITERKRAVKAVPRPLRAGSAPVYVQVARVVPRHLQIRAFAIQELCDALIFTGWVFFIHSGDPAEMAFYVAAIFASVGTDPNFCSAMRRRSFAFVALGELVRLGPRSSFSMDAGPFHFPAALFATHRSSSENRQDISTQHRGVTATTGPTRTNQDESPC